MTTRKMTSPIARPDQRGRAFTLVELLVVIAVVTILAAIAAPTIVRALSAGQSAACKSNLRQIGAALINYVKDFDGLMPSHDDEPGLSFDVWGEKMYWRFAHGALVPFLGGEHRVFACPADADVNPELGARKWFSYTWNTRIGHFNHSSKVYRHRNITECVNPAASITFLDGSEGDGGTDGNDDRPNQPGGFSPSYGFNRHSGGFHALFVDRSVRHFPLGETEGKNYDW